MALKHSPIERYVSTIPLIIIAAISFLIGTLYGKDFHKVEWETISAGVLGLGGGAFALFAAKWSEKRKEIKSVFIYCTAVSARSDITIEKLQNLERLARTKEKMPSDRYVRIANIVDQLLPSKISDNAPIDLLEKHAEISMKIETCKMIEDENDKQDHVRVISTIRSIINSIEELKNCSDKNLSRIKNKT